MVDPLLNWVRKYGKTPMPYSDVSLIQSLINNLNYYLEPYHNEEEKIPKDIIELMNNWVLFSVVWSIGIILEEPSRPKFNKLLTELFAGENVAEKYVLLDLLFPFESKTMM